MATLNDREELQLEKFEEMISLLEKIEDHLEVIRMQTSRQISPS